MLQGTGRVVNVHAAWDSGRYEKRHGLLYKAEELVNCLKIATESSSVAHFTDIPIIPWYIRGI